MLGNCAAVKIGGVEVVLIAKRNQALGPELFSNVGIDPLTAKILVVKSTNHFMAAFGPIARRVIYVESDAPLARDYRKMVYTKVKRRSGPLPDGEPPEAVRATQPNGARRTCEECSGRARSPVPLGDDDEVRAPRLAGEGTSQDPHLLRTGPGGLFDQRHDPHLALPVEDAREHAASRSRSA
ncbi:MAG: MlrC C-terminal domain-containing protein [Betaproteobacteria bacterium]|nr:MlrC C-terminal domain-containing protein [Betaproteobacteria bacterium]